MLSKFNLRIEVHYGIEHYSIKRIFDAIPYLEMQF